MRRGLPIACGLLALAALALVGASLGGLRASSASFTTSSETDVTASAAHVRSWLRLYSQDTDPDGLTGYATQRVVSGVGPPCATGADETLALVMGGIRNNGTTYTFNRAFTMATPVTFPVTGVTQVTVTATYIADGATGLQPIRDVRFNGVGAINGSNPVTLGAGVKRQANVRLRALAPHGYVLGQVYRPTVRLTVTYTGFTTAYYVYDIPLAVTIVDW